MEFNYQTDQDYQKNKLLTESNVLKVITDIKKKGMGMKKVLKSSYDKFMKMIVDKGIEKEFLQIINKQFKTSYKSVKQLNKLKESNMNEDFKHFLGFFKGEFYPALSIFPTLQIWFQIDNLLDGVGIRDLDWKRIGIYAVIWIIILMGQHIIMFKKWQKMNPSDYESEGSPGIFRRGKK